MKTINIGLIGFGTVGSGVVKVLKEKEEILRQKTNCRFKIKAIVDKDITSYRCVKVDKKTLSKNADNVLCDKDIDIVIELIGGVHPAKEFIIKALKNKKDVITANKALLAQEGVELFRIATENKKKLLFEAAVCGGIPIIKALKESLIVNKIDSVLGIINGTANYILTQMQENNWEFKTALACAKKKGIAEANFSLDTKGVDSQHKIAILAQLIFNTYIDLKNIFCEGIEEVKLEDLKYASEFGYAIKLLAVIRRHKEDVAEIYVYPALISQSTLLSKVNGTYNAIFLNGDVVGNLFFYGKGAGMLPTANAVIADLVEIGRLSMKKENYQFPVINEEGKLPVSSYQKLKVKRINDIKRSYYIRFLAVDQPGVLAAIAKILGQKKVSIASVIQKERKENKIVPIVMMTHYAKE